jgi:hypothetical protein
VAALANQNLDKDFKTFTLNIEKSAQEDIKQIQDAINALKEKAANTGAALSTPSIVREKEVNQEKT